MKLRFIKFTDHPILGNLSLDFTVNGKAIDTVIFAGENGTGKSTILNAIMSLSTHDLNQMRYISELEVEHDGLIEKLSATWGMRDHLKFHTLKHGDLFYASPDFATLFPFQTIFSDVAINYNIPKISYVTGLSLDNKYVSLKSTNDTAREIAQLLIDIDAMDAAEYRDEMEKARNDGEDLNNKKFDLRINRFARAFEQMFSHIKWQGVRNVEGSKKVYFEVYGNKVEIGDLSSGEKQIIFRGGYLLKNQYASDGALVLIDEPEISMHPEWQKKIMNFYKNIFTNSSGEQFSQIFAVTHSPFIIHNENRYNDKVIVLKRDDDGKIYVEDKPEYYSCNNVDAIEDAFNINDFNNEIPTLYVEGRTDELYLNKAAEVFAIKLPFIIKWVGHMDKNGQEEFTGKDSLNKLKLFLVGHAKTETILLYDSDTNKANEDIGKVHIRSISKRKNNKNMKVGIENSLVLDNIDVAEFYSIRTEEDNYGGIKQFQDFEKMKMCKYLCEDVSGDIQREVFANLKCELQKLITILNKKKNNEE